jgi:hypothetical protein
MSLRIAPLSFAFAFAFFLSLPPALSAQRAPWIEHPGATWKANAPAGDSPDPGESSEETLVTRPDGAVVAVWTKGSTCCHNVSPDGGKTWGKNACLKAQGSGQTGDPTAGVDDKGNFYIGCEDYSVHEIRMSSSLDGGKSWSDWKSVQAAPDKPWLAAAGDGVVFLTWLGTPGGFKRSLDHGETWEAVKSLGNFSHGTSIAPGLGGLLHIHYNMGNKLRYVRSRDWGATLEPGRDLADMGTACYDCHPRQHPIVGAACDPTGQVVAAIWSATMPGGDGNDDVWAVISRDGGDTWTKPILVNDNPSPSRQFQPWVAVDKYGRVHAVWTDARNNGENGIYYATTLGSKFGVNEEITDRRGRLMGFYGDYKGITIQGDDVLVLWADSRNGDNDIYFSRGAGLAASPNGTSLAGPSAAGTPGRRWTTSSFYDLNGARQPETAGGAPGSPRRSGKVLVHKP